jgi:hypothetical protein
MYSYIEIYLDISASYIVDYIWIRTANLASTPRLPYSHSQLAIWNVSINALPKDKE